MIFLLLSSTAVFLLLTLQGVFFLRALRTMNASFLSPLTVCALGFPLGVFLNALLFFLFLVLGVSVQLSTIIPAHLSLLLCLWFWMRMARLWPWQELKMSITPHAFSGVFLHTLMLILAALLLLKIILAIVSAGIFPTFYYDSLMEWNMRAKMSFFKGSIDMIGDTYRGGTPQPQFPILLHSLQILFMLPQGRWIDQLSNLATLLLSISAFGSFFLVLRRRFGTFWGLLSVWSILAIPLLNVQLSQGYADIHVVAYLLLGASFLLQYIETTDSRALLLSGIFCAAAAWTKQEGFFFGLVPWVLVAAPLSCVRHHWKNRRIVVSVLVTIAAGSLWTAFLILRGMPLGPHSSDFSIAWHPEGIQSLLSALFTMGSFGVHWYFVLITIPLLLILRKRNASNILPLLSWGAIMLAELLFVFLWTPNVRFLLSHQTFHRTALLPLTMLTLSAVLLCAEFMRNRKNLS